MYIEHEQPTEAELAVYFLEEFQSSILLCFSSEANLRWLNDERRIAAEKLLRSEFEKFAKLCLKSIFITLTRINSIDRTHKMWIQTNNRPTIFRVGYYFDRYCDNVLDQNNLFASIGLQLHGGSNDFGQNEWKQLFSMRYFNPIWVIASAFIHELNIGDSCLALSTLINELEIQENATKELKKLLQLDSIFLTQWSNNVLSNISK